MLTISGAVVWVATSDVATGGDSEPGANTFPREDGIGACLRVAHPTLTDAQPLADVLAAEALARDHFFPGLGVTIEPSGPAGEATVVALWPGGEPAHESAVSELHEADACAPAESGWSFGVTHALLADAADRLLERADFGSDWTGNIEVTFHPEEARVRSTLDFSGPFGIEGSCWIDETLAIESDSGRPLVVGQSGDDAGLPGLVACRRFEAEMSEGGAGAQALALLPATIGEGHAEVTLAATGFELTQELLIVRGDVR